MSVPPRNIVIDASVALRFHLKDEELCEEAGRLLDDYQAGALKLTATTLFPYEVGNAVWKAIKRRRIAENDGKAILHDTLALGIVFLDFIGFAERALGFAIEFDRTFYDAAYLALAERLGCEFWTADERFYNAVKDTLSFVRWLGHYQRQAGIKAP